MKNSIRNQLLASTAPVFLWWHAPYHWSLRSDPSNDKIFVTLDKEEQKLFPAEYTNENGKGRWERRMRPLVRIEQSIFNNSVLGAAKHAPQDKVETVQELSKRQHPQQSGRRMGRTKSVKYSDTY